MAAPRADIFQSEKDICSSRVCCTASEIAVGEVLFSMSLFDGVVSAQRLSIANAMTIDHALRVVGSGLMNFQKTNRASCAKNCESQSRKRQLAFSPSKSDSGQNIFEAIEVDGTVSDQLEVVWIVAEKTSSISRFAVAITTIKC